MANIDQRYSSDKAKPRRKLPKKRMMLFKQREPLLCAFSDLLLKTINALNDANKTRTWYNSSKLIQINLYIQGILLIRS